MVVSDGGTVVTSSGTYTGVAEGGVIGYNASASNNTVTVTGSGSAWNNAYNVVVGYGGSGNSLLVSAGGAVTAGKAFGTVESVKAVSDLFAPLSGTIVAVNAALVRNSRKADRGGQMLGNHRLRRDGY